MTEKKKGRERGSLNKKATTFLNMCKEHFDFEPAKDFIRLYTPLKIRLAELEADFGTSRMTPELRAEYFSLFSIIKEGLTLMMKYSYPTLKSSEITGDSGMTHIFNINTLLTDPKISGKKMINITPQQNKPAPIQIGENT